MKTYVYLILAVLLASIIMQPLLEVAMVCREKINIGTAMTNSVRVAQKESYTYTGMREGDAIIDKQTFLSTFARTFASALDLQSASISGNTFVFKSHNDVYDDFTVKCTFTEETVNGRKQTKVTVESKSDYKFKTKYLKEAQDIISSHGNVYKLIHKRTYTMKMTN